jgi:DNA-binding NtrC family response regulator
MAKILVVDDDKLIRWSLTELLSQEGFEVNAVSSTEDALNLAEEANFRIIFCDLEVDDENGFEMLQKISSLQPDAKMIILSALSRTQIEQQLGNTAVFSIVEKPFTSDEIKLIAREALNI